MTTPGFSMAVGFGAMVLVVSSGMNLLLPNTSAATAKKIDDAAAFIATQSLRDRRQDVAIDDRRAEIAALSIALAEK
jgi:hypothetical protein